MKKVAFLGLGKMGGVYSSEDSISPFGTAMLRNRVPWGRSRCAGGCERA